MPILSKSKKLKKELTLINVYAIGTGTTLSAGLFLLPGMAAAQAGPAMILSYLFAAVPLVPAMFCMMELATAMPRAGGMYYFLDRSMGPLVGTIGGLGTWFSLMLKSAFALIGMGAYLSLFLPGNYVVLIAVGFALFFGAVNLIGAKESGRIQVFLVAGILILLGGFIYNGMTSIHYDYFSNFFAMGHQSVFATAGFVYISYVGITKVASVAEEVKDPERNLPLGMFLSFLTAIVVYGLATYILVGVVPMEELKVSLTPMALAAEYMIGPWGKVLITIAAVLAFSSVTNAGILSASRYPLAMSRDHLISTVFRKFSKNGIPVNAILLTVGMILFFIIFLNPMKIAKLASAFQLLMFALCCLAVIIMRESKIEAYDPGYIAPFYPWMQIVGIVVPFWLITEMGEMPILFSFILIIVGGAWYFYYARQRVARRGAILHVFERLGRGRCESLDPELRGILKEKGLREEDPFDELVTQALFIDLDKGERFDQVIKMASKILSREVSCPSKHIEANVLDGTKIGATPVSHGVALPHMRLHNIIEPILLMMRSKKGISVEMDKSFWGDFAPPDEPIYAIFFLISPEENPRQHLRILAKIASHVDDEHFMKVWKEAQNEQVLKEILLRDEHFTSLQLKVDTKAKAFIGKCLKDLDIPEDALIAMIYRDDKIIVPTGSKLFKEGDRLTIIGKLKGIQEFRRRFGNR